MSGHDPLLVRVVQERAQHMQDADLLDETAEAIIRAVEPLIRREVLADLRAKVEVLRAYAVDIKFEWKDPAQAERAVLLRDVIRLIEEAERG